MSPTRVTFYRTLGHSRNLYSSALGFWGFLAVTMGYFIFVLNNNDGSKVSLIPLWVYSISVVLPLFSALVAMDSWSDERSSGRLDVLLASPVKERQLVMGKFLGVWTIVMSAVLVSLVSTLAFLDFFAPLTLKGVYLTSFIPGLLALGLEAALWCALASAMSSLSRHAATAAIASIIISVIIPRAAWQAVLCWLPNWRTIFGEFPLDSFTIDFASGLVSTGMLVLCVLLTFEFLLFAAKVITIRRYVGKRSLGLRISTIMALMLSVFAVIAAIAFAFKTEFTIDMNMDKGEMSFSRRTHNILTETSGEVVVTAFLSRKDSRFRSVAYCLRSLRRAAISGAAANFNLLFVDPNWDVGAAERLVRLGVKEGSVVFENRRRMTVIAVDDAFGERTCASAILRLTTPPSRRKVCWTFGHGEFSFSDYSDFGMSDIARELSRDGYHNELLDFTANSQIPSDCALIIIAGAKEEFSRFETSRIEAYLKQGGRLLVMTNSSQDSGGVASILTSWGIRPTEANITVAKSLTGTDVVASEFSNHVIVGPIAGAQVIFENPVVFEASAAAEQGAGADRISFSPLAIVDKKAVSAVAERGNGVGADTAIRPTRIVVIGDSGFVMNGQLAIKANANRDFFLNCVAYLSGTDAMTAADVDGNTMITGMDTDNLFNYIVYGVGVFPFAIFLILFASAYRRRHRL